MSHSVSTVRTRMSQLSSSTPDLSQSAAYHSWAEDRVVLRQWHSAALQCLALSVCSTHCLCLQLMQHYPSADGRVAKSDYITNYLKIFGALQPDMSPSEAAEEAEVHDVHLIITSQLSQAFSCTGTPTLPHKLSRNVMYYQPNSMSQLLPPCALVVRCNMKPQIWLT